MHIYLVGNGKMATALITACNSQNTKLTRYGEDFDYSNENYGKPVAIHFGSGRQLHELIDLCEDLQIPIIQGSTRLVTLPSDRNVVIINAPNLSIPMVRFIASFPEFAKAIGVGMELRIVESHQSRKVDTSGTARVIAKTLNISELAITSIRDKDTQLELGVPKEHLDGHAYHYFTLTGQGVEFKLSTKIEGRRTYAEGALTLAKALANLKNPMVPGIYELKDIFHLLPKE